MKSSLGFSFPKGYRKLTKQQSVSLFSDAQTLFVYPFKVFYLIEKNEENKQLMKVLISVSKSRLKLAVDRNLIKRFCRESIRLNKLPLEKKLLETNLFLCFALVFVGKEILPHHQIRQSVIVVIKKLKDITCTYYAQIQQEE